MITDHAGKLVPLQETIKGFQTILAGELGHLPEVAFYMVGPIEEVVAKEESNNKFTDIKTLLKFYSIIHSRKQASKEICILL